jgi:hypothetical protein
MHLLYIRFGAGAFKAGAVGAGAALRFGQAPLKLYDSLRLRLRFIDINYSLFSYSRKKVCYFKSLAKNYFGKENYSLQNR